MKSPLHTDAMVTRENPVSLNSAYLVGNRYQLVRKLGEGSMGTVYQALDRLTNTAVALKRFKLKLEDLESQSEAVFRQRSQFIQEFRVLSSLHHPYVIPVTDFGFDTDGRPFFTMKLLMGVSTIVDAGRTCDVEGKISLLIKTLHALHYIHRNSIIHNDLKPTNILVNDTDQLRVLDFGLARAADTDLVHEGTWTYMAPEKLIGSEVSETSDLYSLGIVTYEMFAGKPPLEDASFSKLLVAKISEKIDVNALDAPDGIRELIRGLLHSDPRRRYPNALAVIEALHKIIGQPYSEKAFLREPMLLAAKFSGRLAEQDQLAGALAACFSNHGSSWLIAGESGSGKSRLLDEISDSAMITGATVIKYRYEDHGQAASLWNKVISALLLFTKVTDEEASICKIVVPDTERILGRRVPSIPSIYLDDYPELLNTVLLEIFRRQSRPVVLLIDDLQWSRENLKPLRNLSQAAPSLPLLIVGTYRNDEMRYLYGKLPEMTLLQLKPFSVDEIQSLTCNITGNTHAHARLIDFLFRQTEGNAFFLIESLRSLATVSGGLERIGSMEVPEDVFSEGMLDIVRRRTTGLTEDQMRALQSAAVIGREIDFELLAAIDDSIDYDTWLIACMDRNILKLDQGIWYFAHQKIREGVLYDISDEARRILHEAVALGIEGLHPEDQTYALQLMLHWRRAGRIVKELFYLLLSIPHAIQTGNHELIRTEAQETLHRAAQTTQYLHEQMLLHIYLAEIDDLLQDYNSAIAHYQCGISFAIRLNQVAVEAKAIRGMAWVQCHQGNFEGAAYTFEKAQQQYEMIQDLDGMGQILNDLGQLYFMQHDHEVASSYYAQAKFIAEHIDNQHMLTISYRGLADTAMTVETHKEAVRFICRVLTLSDKDSPDADSTIHMNIVHLLVTARACYHLAVGLTNDIMALYEGAGDHEILASAREHIALLLAEPQCCSESRRHLEHRTDAARRLGEYTLLAERVVSLAHSHILCGNWEAARNYLNEWLNLSGAYRDEFVILHGLYCLFALANLQEKYQDAFLWLGMAEALAARVPGEKAIIDTLYRAMKAVSNPESARVQLEKGRQMTLQDLRDRLFADPESGFVPSDKVIL